MFPWATFLPRPDRRLFIDELTRTPLALSLIDSFVPVGELFRECRATAAIRADLRLAPRLHRPIETEGAPVSMPAG